jgi:microcompartment protein CcmL/EutN
MAKDNKKGFVGNALDAMKSVAGEALQKGAETVATVVVTRAAEGATDLIEGQRKKQKPKKKAAKKSAPKRKAAAKKTTKKSAKKRAKKASKKKRI